MIEPMPHTAPQESWDVLCTWIADNVKMPEGGTPAEHVVKVLAVGAIIGARHALISPTFALGLAAYSNDQEGELWRSIQLAFAKDYLPWIGPQVEAFYHNLGFTHVTHMPAVVERTDEPREGGITDEDAKSILDGLDGFFGGEPA